MGHIVNTPRTYRLLQQRLDRNVTGAPDSPVLTQILKLLFSPEEADLARQIPTKFTSLRRLSRQTGIPLPELDARIDAMAARGLVVDIQQGDRRYVSLAPVVIGFFEFTFMRVRQDLPMKQLAELFDQYFYENGRFVHAVFRGQTQIGRSLVREEALAGSLPDADYTEVLEWERASHIVETATAHAVSLCACRHHASHLDHACTRPQRVCLSLNKGAEILARHGIAERITPREAMQILEESKAAGLAQTGDNVQRNVGYICNCCGCCCGMMNAIRRYDIRNAIVSSNYISEIDPERCKGCGRCVKACPVHAIELVIGQKDGRRRGWAVRNADLCLGCGVCYSTCRDGALKMVKRERRVFTPESTFDRIVAMAIERGKLGDMLLDNTEGWSAQALARVVQVLEKTPVEQALLAIAPLRSIFLRATVEGVKVAAGKASRAM